MRRSREFGSEKGADDAFLVTFLLIGSATNGIGFPVTLVEHLSGKALVVQTSQTKGNSQTEDTGRVNRERVEGSSYYMSKLIVLQQHV